MDSIGNVSIGAPRVRRRARKRYQLRTLGMSSTQSPSKRFRIERLEERITPGMLFWAEDLGVNTLTQWGVIEASDSPPNATQIAARSNTVGEATFIESNPAVTAKPETSEFPTWAARILQEIEHELSSQKPTVRVPPGFTNDVTFFSDFMNASNRDQSMDDNFPIWAQELLADLEQRPANEPASRSIAESDVRLASNDEDVRGDFIPPECETGRFPIWAEQLLSAVDRRIEHDSRIETAGSIGSSQSHRLNELINRRLPSARMVEAQVGE